MNAFNPHHLQDAATQMQRVFNRPIVFLDYEFNNSAEPVLNLVCGSLQMQGGSFEGLSKITSTWLKNEPEKYKLYRKNIEDIQKKYNPVWVSYAVSAEARSFLALGLDPHKFDWVDLYAEWRQLTFNNNSCQYGTYYQNGFKRKSVPPSYDYKKNEGRDNNAVGMGMVDCVAQMTEIYIDSKNKTAMRDLILKNKDHYSHAERAQIVRYCESDVSPLPCIWSLQFQRLRKATGLDAATLARVQIRRAQFMVSIAKMEQLGFPLHLPYIRNLRNNHNQAKNEIIKNLVENHYPFYLREKKRAGDLQGQWVDKYSQFETFVKSKGLYKSWPRTWDKKKRRFTETLSRDDKTLAAYDGIPEIREYRKTREHINQIGWFQEPDPLKKKKSGDFFDSVGSDARLRTFLGAFGTQTSRNAPKASRFVLAMSAWLRCVVKPPEGYAIVAIDYASQEFAIAAVMSNDPSMVAAYLSGDPYLYFAKKAGAVPESARPDWCKNPDSAPKAEREAYREYKRQRRLFKATTLGLQYGMGATKLAVKLTVDTGIRCTETQAKKLIALHQRVYPVYWRWLKKVSSEYDRKRRIILWNGWALLGDNGNVLSVRNFSVQGTGAVIMQEAVRIGHAKYDLPILGPLHDAIYMLSKVEDLPEQRANLITAMQQAVKNVLGDRLKIRLDIEVHHAHEDWVEEKGEKYYNLLKKYLQPGATKEDRIKNLEKTIFSLAS